MREYTVEMITTFPLHTPCGPLLNERRITINCIFTDPLKYHRAFVDIKVADLFRKSEGKWCVVEWFRILWYNSGKKSLAVCQSLLK